MNHKTIYTLELDKILAQLAEHAAFSASKELLEALEPTAKLNEALYRQQETTEARDLLEENSMVTVGGVRDIRSSARNATLEITLTPQQFLDIRATLESSTALKKTLGKLSERFPLLNEIAVGLHEGKGLISAINRTIDNHGLILDSASPRLAQTRHDLRVTQDRLHNKLQAILTNSKNAPYLQEAIITARSGRFVIPIRAESKGRIKGIVHDASSSGATLFIEPLATVEINNKIRELEVAEADEIQHLLHQLTLLVGGEADQLVWTVEALAALDAAFAKAKYAGRLNASSPVLVGFDPDRRPGSTIRLYGARHPLLDQDEVVPIDVELDDETHLLVITGPNTGGKTVSLKTVGLLILMAQCGLHIPATDGSTLTVFKDVFADIGEEQSIEQSLSTFSAHMTHVIQILEEADDEMLVIFDELGSGTDPGEGAAIARAILNDLLERGVTSFVATHYPELKLYAHSTASVRNASVEFDLDTLSPTYRLIIGLPGRSNALAIATRLGLPQYIIDEARGYVGEDDLHVDDLLDEINQTREEIREAQTRLLLSERETEQLRGELNDRLDGIETEREDIIEAARAEAAEELEAVQAEIIEMRRRFKTLSPTQKMLSDAQIEDYDSLADDAEAVGSLLKEPVKKVAEPVSPMKNGQEQQPRELRVGDTVFISNLNTTGDIVAIKSGDDIEVQVGNLRIRVDADKLERRKKQRAATTERQTMAIQTESPGLELHLIGFMVEDALPALDAYIDQAYLSGLPWVRIVHGKGTGVLRQAVQAALKKNPLVKEYAIAPPNDGGNGVTIAKFGSEG